MYYRKQQTFYIFILFHILLQLFLIEMIIWDVLKWPCTQKCLMQYLNIFYSSSPPPRLPLHPIISPCLDLCPRPPHSYYKFSQSVKWTNNCQINIEIFTIQKTWTKIICSIKKLFFCWHYQMTFESPGQCVV